MALGKVYTFGPTFRAEKSKTRRHLTEFWMLEPEMAYAELEDVMQLSEDMLVAVVAEVLERRPKELEVLERDLSKLEAIQSPFPRLSYDEASAILQEHPESEFVHGHDFGATDETILSERYDRPVLIHRYPKEVKSFYMKRDPEDDSKCLCVDVLGSEGVGEIIGEWYLDLRRYGSVPHGGFGLGLERTVAWICGIPHVREASPFPRMMTRLEP